MARGNEYLLKSFVDRTTELETFSKIVKKGAGHIFVVHGPGGMGKSLFLQRLIQECEELKAQSVLLEWDDSQRYNYRDIMRRIRDDTDIELFDLFTDRIKYFTERAYELKINISGGDIGEVEVLEGGEIRDSDVTIHVGHNIEIKDTQIDALRADRAFSEDEVRIELTHAFIPCLKAVTKKAPLVLFLDAIEKADALTPNWIERNLLAAIRDQTIPNFVAVVSGRECFELDPSYFECSRILKLEPFELPDILDYLEIRANTRDKPLGSFILATSKGNPRETATGVDTWIRSLMQS